MEYFTIINFVLVFLGLLIGFVISKFLEKTSITKSLENAKKETENILKSASIEGENIKKDKIFQAKEKFLELKSEHEKHILSREKNLTDVQKRIKDKESQVSNELSINKKNNQSLNDKISSFDKKIELLDKKSEQVDKLHKEQVEKLEKLSSMSASDAKKELVQSLKEEAKTEALELTQNIIEDAKLTAMQEAKKIVINTIQRVGTEEAIDNCVSVFNIESDDVKGRIIGREGRNIRAIESATGVEIIVDDTPEAIILSCFDSVRREVARLSLHKLVTDGRIHPARIEEVVKKTKKEIEDVIGIEADDAILCSAKTGQGIEDVLETVVHKVPAPVGDIKKPLKALIIDAWFDNYVGVVMLVRVIDGEIKAKDKIHLMATKDEYACESVGIFTPKSIVRDSLGAGEVGFVIAGIKDLESTKVGDTITLSKNKADEALPGFKEIQPQVFAGLYPIESNQFDALRTALEKLKLNDASLNFEPENSTALGFGFRCGFLGLLHMDIIQERLEREYEMELITTAPTVVYELLLKNDEVISIENPSRLPDLSTIEEIREPIINLNIFRNNIRDR